MRELMQSGLSAGRSLPTTSCAKKVSSLAPYRGDRSQIRVCTYELFSVTLAPHAGCARIAPGYACVSVHEHEGIRVREVYMSAHLLQCVAHGVWCVDLRLSNHTHDQ